MDDYVYNLVVDRGAMPVETPIFYDLDNQAIYEHAYKFGERQYKTATKKDLMLFASLKLLKQPNLKETVFARVILTKFLILKGIKFYLKFQNPIML